MSSAIYGRVFELSLSKDAMHLFSCPTKNPAYLKIGTLMWFNEDGGLKQHILLTRKKRIQN